MRSLAAVLALASCARFSSEEIARRSEPADVGVIINDDGGLSSSDRADANANANAPLDGGDDNEERAATNGNVMACAAFVDRTLPDASRALTWDFTFPITEERCIEVRVGQSVRFTDGAGQAARFDIHSVQASGGDHPSPVSDLLDLQTGNVTFATPGTFGFLCVDHRTMRGAIRAVP